MIAIASLLAACAADEPSEPLPDGLEVEVIRDIQLTEQARIPQDDPAFRSVEILADRLLFELDGPLAAPLEPGHVVTGNGGPEGYLRRVLTVSTAPDGRLEVTTEPAQLTDLIASGHFIVRYDVPDAHAEEAGDGVAGRSEPLRTVGHTSLAREGTARCGLSNGVEYWYDIDYSVEVEVDIENPTGSFALIHEYRTELDAIVHAGAEVGLQHRNLDFTCTLSDLAVEEIDLGTFAFTVGRVPIALAIRARPSLDLSIAGSVGTESLVYSFGAEVDLSAGWGFNGHHAWEPAVFSEGSYEPGVAPAAIGLTSVLELGVDFEQMLNGIPSGGILIHGTSLATSSTGTDVCTWRSSVQSNISATFLDFFGEPYWRTAPAISPERWLDGSFAECTACTEGLPTCRDDLGREICAEGRGLLSCPSGALRFCLCGTDGAFTECGRCTIGSDEACGNGIDDDGDGEIDEGCGASCSTDADCEPNEACFIDRCEPTCSTDEDCPTGMHCGTDSLCWFHL